MNYIPCKNCPIPYPYTNSYTRSLCVETDSDNNTMNLNGKGAVQAKPNIAVVSLGVVTENMDLNDALKENTLKMSKVIASLKNMGIAEKDIKTESYNIELVYDYIEGKQVFKGYRVRNMLSVTIRDINSVGEVINTAVDNGANVVNSINFTVSNPSLYYREALNLAIKDAIEKAAVIEKSLRIVVNKTPSKILEETYGYAPIPSNSMTFKTAGPPIMPGETEITASIKATFSYKDL